MNNNKQTKPSKASEYILTSENVRDIINATKSIRDKVIIELLAFTGCRRSELVLLRVMDINLDIDQIIISHCLLHRQVYLRRWFITCPVWNPSFPCNDT